MARVKPQRATSEFFVDVLSNREGPTSYEVLRGHVSSARDDIKLYVKMHLRGEKLLTFFERRSNYFMVTNRNMISLNPDGLLANKKTSKDNKNKRESINKSNERASATKTIKNSKTQWDMRACTSGTKVPSASSSNTSIDEEKWKKTVLDYFLDMVNRKPFCYRNIELNDLPKHVHSYLNKHFSRQKVLRYFLDNHRNFRVDDDGIVHPVLDAHQSDFEVVDAEDQEKDTFEAALLEVSDKAIFKDMINNPKIRVLLFCIRVLKESHKPMSLGSLKEMVVKEKTFRNFVRCNLRGQKFTKFLKEYNKIFRFLHNSVSLMKGYDVEVVETCLGMDLSEDWQVDINYSVCKDATAKSRCRPKHADVAKKNDSQSTKKLEEASDVNSTETCASNTVQAPVSALLSAKVETKLSSQLLSYVKESGWFDSICYGGELDDKMKMRVGHFMWTFELFCLEIAHWEMNEGEVVLEFFKVNLQDFRESLSMDSVPLEDLSKRLEPYPDVANHIKRKYPEGLVSFFSSHSDFKVHDSELISLADKAFSLKRPTALTNLYFCDDFMDVHYPLFKIMLKVSIFLRSKHASVNDLINVFIQFDEDEKTVINFFTGSSLKDKVKSLAGLFEELFIIQSDMMQLRGEDVGIFLQLLAQGGLIERQKYLLKQDIVNTVPQNERNTSTYDDYYVSSFLDIFRFANGHIEQMITDAIIHQGNLRVCLNQSKPEEISLLVSEVKGTLLHIMESSTKDGVPFSELPSQLVTFNERILSLMSYNTPVVLLRRMGNRQCYRYSCGKLFLPSLFKIVEPDAVIEGKNHQLSPIPESFEELETVLIRESTSFLENKSPPEETKNNDISPENNMTVEYPATDEFGTNPSETSICELHEVAVKVLTTIIYDTNADVDESILEDIPSRYCRFLCRNVEVDVVNIIVNGAESTTDDIVPDFESNNSRDINMDADSPDSEMDVTLESVNSNTEHSSTFNDQLDLYDVSPNYPVCSSPLPGVQMVSPKNLKSSVLSLSMDSMDNGSGENLIPVEDSSFRMQQQHVESCSGDVMTCSVFEGTVVLITQHDCLVQVVNGTGYKIVFCFNDLFQCSRHTNCSDTAQHLTIGQSVKCYVMAPRPNDAVWIAVRFTDVNDGSDDSVSDTDTSTPSPTDSPTFSAI